MPLEKSTAGPAANDVTRVRPPANQRILLVDPRSRLPRLASDGGVVRTVRPARSRENWQSNPIRRIEFEPIVNPEIAREASSPLVSARPRGEKEQR